MADEHSDRRCQRNRHENGNEADAVQAFDVLHGREIAMPRMYDWLVTALNEHNSPVTDALTNPAFNLLDRQRLKTWQTRFYRQLYRAADLLLTDPHAAEKFVA